MWMTEQTSNPPRIVIMEERRGRAVLVLVLVVVERRCFERN